MDKMESTRDRKRQVAKGSWCLPLLGILAMAGAAATAPATAAVPNQYASTCSDCHEMPPIDSLFRNITTGAFRGNHNTHAIASRTSCVRCHQSSAAYSSGHMKRTVTLAANINSSPATGQYIVSGTPVTFVNLTSAPLFGTCSNVNCHFEKATPSWGSTTFASSGNCGKCHGAPPDDGNHARHSEYYGPGAPACRRCHPNHTAEASVFAHATSAGKRSLALPGVTYSKPENLAYPSYLPSQAPVRNGTCSSISCHGNTAAAWGGTACLDCHAVSQGNRAAITPQFGANSHHIQGTVSNTHCYQCHWEANSDGSINSTYHNSKTPGGPVDLVIYGAGTRPAAYVADTTAIQYTANNTRVEIAKISTHCLSCHNDQNNGTQPFGDGKTPRQYAWDATSIAARYSQTGVTTWGKYSTVANAAKKRIAKAYSAHGKAASNLRGWDTTNGVDGTITNTSGGVNVECFDCHNSHGSSVAGVATRYVSATVNGGILKDTTAGLGGYAVSYRPYTGGTAAAKNRRNPGASLCLDCHLNATAARTPWGYTATFGATQPILGYFDSPFMGYSGAGVKKRYPYKSVNLFKGGHFGASSPLAGSVMGSIDGLCTPCHDPHGVSPTLGVDRQYAVPLLKGTWITSPYQEDVTPANNSWRTNYGGTGVLYRIDQNTFGANIGAAVTGVTQSVAQSSGLCLSCHPQTSLTVATTPAAPNAWKSKNRIHESVKEWKTSSATVRHSYTCSKCHTVHSASVLPRLMVTNCLDSNHKGRLQKTPSPIINGSSSGDWGGGNGRMPGTYTSYGDSSPGNFTVTCHESPTANGGDGTVQRWNNVTPWVYP